MLYYYPNRPILIAADPDNPMNPKPDYLNELEASGQYIAEQKWNGDNALIYTSSREFWNRSKRKLKYQPTPEVIKELNKWPKRCLLNAELVHTKTKSIKNKIIVHCVMVWKNKCLNGKTWGDSRKLLESMPSGKHVIVSPVWKKGFWDLYQAADGSEIEGIILKNPSGKLIFSTTPISDVPWMRKVRKKSKKYAF